MTKPKPKDQLQKRGRKSLFREEFILIAKAAARFGAIEDEIADELKISPGTLDNFKKKYPEFLSALKAGKEASDAQVERALYQRAIGYSHPAVKAFMTRDGKIVEHKYVEHYPPDPASMCFWLKNRRPDRWRDVQRIDAAMGHYVLSDRPMTEEEWIRERATVDAIDVTHAVTPKDTDTK
jgi:hypothetical protein